MTSFNGRFWNESEGDDRYRRAVYTYWKRTNSYPSMVAFDSPSREVCTSKRVRTNTPLQALTLLNDPAYVEAADAMAKKIMKHYPGDLEQGIKESLQLVTGIPPQQEKTDRKSTRLNSSHVKISYAVFCLKKKMGIRSE